MGFWKDLLIAAFNGAKVVGEKIETQNQRFTDSRDKLERKSDEALTKIVNGSGKTRTDRLMANQILKERNPPEE